MKLKWETIDTGMGYNIHQSMDYIIEPEDLDIKLWEVFYAGESLGLGTWQTCRKIAQSHSEGAGK